MSLTKFTHVDLSQKSIEEKNKTTKKTKRNYFKETLKSDKYKEADSQTKRNLIQSSVKRTWKEFDYYGFFLISMGVGKSKIIADCIKEYKKWVTKAKKEGSYKEPDIDVLILVNSSALRDTGLPMELKKWKVPLSDIKIECYQWVHRNKDIFKLNIGLVIGDEIDFALSEEYSKMFHRFKTTKKLFLTGTLADEKRELITKLKNFPPILGEYKLQQAQLDGVINQIKILLHEVPLSTERNVKVTLTVKGKQQTYYKSENEQYLYTQDKIESFRKLIHVYKKQGSIGEVNKFSALKKWYESSPKNSNSRLQQMTANKSLLDYADKLRNLIKLDNPENKIIFFATRTELIDKLTPHGYYGDVSDEIIERFNTGEIDEIGVCKKANRGVSFRGLNHCIAQSYDSSQTNQNQGILGRMTRLGVDQIAYLHILVSTYINDATKEVDYCQNFNWVADLLDNSVGDVIRITDIKDTLKYIQDKPEND